MDTATLDSLSQRVALAARSGLGSGITVAADGRVVGRFLQTRLTSVFEPVFELADGRVSGAQAGVRTVDSSGGPGLAPWEVFAAAARPRDLVDLDRLARTVHALGFESLAQPGQALHLSMHPRLLDAVTEHHGQVYRGLLEALGLGALLIVIELPAIAPGEESRIAPVAASYRRHGFGVAFRPVSRRQLDALLVSCTLDTLRIDADRLVRFGAVDEALRAARKRRIGIVVERVRSAFDVALARELGATHVQGPLFGEPVPAPDLHTPLSGRAGGVPSQSDRVDVRRYLMQGA
jgi:EAL domain-containing protein (putative c-di-GMP-specific phosphodiesterase class I)